MESHRLRAISTGIRVAATAVVLVSACTDSLLDPTPTVMAEDDLLFLAVQASAPSTGVSTFTVNTGQAVTHRTLHNDAFRTQFLEIAFPPNPVVEIGTQAVAPGEAVDITVRPEAARYAATIEPSQITFDERDPPTLRFTFGRYGDRSVADGSTRYPTRAAYGAALRLWVQVGAGQWERIDASFTDGPDAVAARINTSGHYAVAAPR